MATSKAEQKLRDFRMLYVNKTRDDLLETAKLSFRNFIPVLKRVCRNGTGRDIAFLFCSIMATGLFTEQDLNEREIEFFKDFAGMSTDAIVALNHMREAADINLIRSFLSYCTAEEKANVIIFLLCVFSIDGTIYVEEINATVSLVENL